VILGDLVAVILGFLNGELTTRFLLKALTIFVVVGAASWYYLKDAQGYWTTHESASKQYGAAVAVLVIASIIGGYLRIEAPGEMRDRALDQRQVNDLSQIQSFVLSHYAEKNALPGALTDIALSNQLPTAPEARAQYTYSKVSEASFKLCASFALASDPKTAPLYTGWSDPMLIKNGDDWNHSEGEWCFTRVLNPQAPMVPTFPVMN
jgi:type II secretory pathway pseudopilin PulG